MSLATKKMQERWENERKRHHVDVGRNEDEDDIDLFSRDRECLSVDQRFLVMIVLQVS